MQVSKNTRILTAAEMFKVHAGIVGGSVVRWRQTSGVVLESCVRLVLRARWHSLILFAVLCSKSAGLTAVGFDNYDDGYSNLATKKCTAKVLFSLQ